MVKYFSAFFVCWHFVKLKIFLFPGPQFRIGVMSAVRDGKSYLRWDRPDTLLHWWQLLGWGWWYPWPVIPNIFLIKNNTNGQAGNEKFMLDVDNNKYKRCFLRYCQSLIWKDQSFSFSIIWHFAWCEVRIDRVEMSRELWEKLDPMALYGAHLARLKLTWTKQFTILRGTVKDCLLGLNRLV